MSKALKAKVEKETVVYVGGQRVIPAGKEAGLSQEERALAAVIVNMLGRHTHGQRQAILKFALSQEKFIPVSQTSVFEGTDIMPR